ncbi:MAG: hypothetical protein NC086_05075 [Alistipes sp.]|nr:hypothetical protein [Alistipes sp.]
MGNKMKKSNQSYRINIKNPVYCEVISDTEEGTTYGPVISLGQAQEIQITSSMASGMLHGNGALVDSTSLMTGLAVSMKVTKLNVEVVADIYGYEVTDGVVQIPAGTVPKEIALGYEVEQTDGKSEYIWLLKGKPKPTNSTVQQSETSINYSTDTIEIDFVKRISDNMLKYYADASNPEFSKEQAKTWFSEGPSTFPKKPTASGGTQEEVTEPAESEEEQN